MLKKSKEWLTNQEYCAFPRVKPPLQPLRDLVLVQYRNSRISENKTKGGIIVVRDGTTQRGAQDRWLNLIVRVVALGPLAFQTRNLDTGEMKKFSEGPWYSQGQFVRVPAQGVDHLFVQPTPEELQQMKIDSENADRLKESPEFKATEGLSEGLYVKFGLLQSTDILAVIDNFYTTVNGI